LISLISYPRSGNTFLRNVLHQVYGIASKTYHNEAHGADLGWESALVVKSHLLPHQLPEPLLQRPIIYLIRDGRDAVVSVAHHRSDVMAVGSDFDQNLAEATFAAEGSHFSGWSNHTKTWGKQAAIIIRFEDLIENPIAQIERLRPFLDLPAPKIEALPSFADLQAGSAIYGSGKSIGKDLSMHWFRKGKVNGWQTEMSAEQHDLFWHLHGESMQVFGYRFDGSHAFDLPLISADFQVKCGLKEPELFSSKTLLIEASKLSEPFFDGIKRYVFELLKTANNFPIQQLQVFALVNDDILSIDEALAKEGIAHKSIESGMLFWAKSALKIVLPNNTYNQLAKTIPLAAVRSFFSFRKSKSGEEKNVVFDHALLTLPQNYLHFKGHDFRRLTTVVHDLSHETHPQFHEANNIDRTSLGMQFSLKNQADFISVSSHTTKDLEARDIPSVVNHEGVDRSVFFPIQNQHLLALVRERYNLPNQPFLLSVCTLEPRKNIPRLIAAYAKLPRQIRSSYHLVLAGRKGWKWNEFEIPDHCIKQIHFTGFVREDHLPALYTLAHGFCYVSLYEGFGLPVLEAMACACPVLVSNNSSIPEITGDTAISCDPKNIDAIEHGLMQLIEQAADAEHRKKAMRQSWNFTWAKHWEKMAETFKSV